MSLRRKSCDTCFHARRKCDLTYPVCNRCRRNNKECHFLYPPSARDGSTRASSIAHGDGHSKLDLQTPNEDSLHQDSSPFPALDLFDPDTNMSDANVQLQIQNYLAMTTPNLLTPLGEPHPLLSTSASETWTWLLNQFTTYPSTFVQTAQTNFIHPTTTLFRSQTTSSPSQSGFPPALRAAFGVCAAYTYINDSNQTLVFQNLDSEVSKLLRSSSSPSGQAETLAEAAAAAAAEEEEADTGTSLATDLSRLQALVLYQTIRLLTTRSLAQRIKAEQQEGILLSWCLRLLSRAQRELPPAPSTATAATTTSNTNLPPPPLSSASASSMPSIPSWPEPHQEEGLASTSHSTAASRAIPHDTWVLAESIRRTVAVAFLLCAVHSVLRHGVCLPFQWLTVLPVSANAAALWSGSGSAQGQFEGQQQQQQQDDNGRVWEWEAGASGRAGGNGEDSNQEVVSYSKFTTDWLVAPVRRLDEFEKLLLVACKGVDKVEAFSGLVDFV